MLNNNTARIASLNARSFLKEAQSQQQSQFTRNLRSHALNIDILALQEVSQTHTSSLTNQDISHLHRLFPNSSSCFTKHCALICLSPSFTLSNTYVTIDQRCIISTICTSHGALCRIVVLYAFAERARRPEFFSSLLDLPCFIDNSEPCLIIGDFNTHLHTTLDPGLRPWGQSLLDHFHNCMYPELTDMLSPPHAAPTFHRGDTHTTVDYIFCSHDLRSRISNAQQWYMSRAWTDHEMLTMDLRVHDMDTGPGCWRFNPVLLDDEPQFDLLLQSTVNGYFDQLDEDLCEVDPQMCWDNLKAVLKETAIDYSFRQSLTIKQQLRTLQRRRHGILQQHGHRDPRLPPLEKEIDTIQERITKQLLLRSAIRWHESGERNNKYFFNVLKQRQAATTIHHLRDPQTRELFTTMGDIMQHARHFYMDIYSPTEIDQPAVDHLLSSIPSSVRVTEAQGNHLIRPFTLDELVGAIDHSPLGRSPGMDGLPFELFKHMQTWEPVLRLLLSVMNQALLQHSYPRSWMSTRMVLLYKKGDPQLLANWRPLSLINSDAKLFTKLLANRLQPIMHHLINPFQTGFLAKRLISDNGWVAQNLMHHVRRPCPSSSSVGVLLDQEKAYDRVHPDYLKQVMTRFGFPPPFIDSFLHLFFSTSISISINGWLSSPVSQLRGLRQGDPISPLFNIAFEPFIRTLISDPFLLGSPLTNPNTNKKWNQRIHFRTNLSSSHVPPFKVLAYADDLLVFLQSPTEWHILLKHLKTYNLASNSKINLNKTVVFPLSGEPNPSWQIMLATMNTSWHDRTSPNALT
ncbi:hypothetical protein RO3G_11686 [Lichtheimia corymbifera JMRC:FSU:9682]|uniref:Reverse transcriptase domain-containing protein n=1 Tax=Lichtheimia corymbifera JMRC:FSU:9682 TaxID=1263082 RepID=A0A068RYU8_9FUNG|nr:hypothetical protein RO3G_11686 [Lichtheimia corymbifera JMRC:FSU:9682]